MGILWWRHHAMNSWTGQEFWEKLCNRIPGGGGGGTPDFKWQGWSNGGKKQNPKKSLDQNLTSKQSHTQFPSHKHFQRNYAAQIFRLFWITHKIPRLKLSHPQKIFLGSLIAKNENFPTQKSQNGKISNPPKSFNHPCHLKSGVPLWE